MPILADTAQAWLRSVEYGASLVFIPIEMAVSISAEVTHSPAPA